MCLYHLWLHRATFRPLQSDCWGLHCGIRAVNVRKLLLGAKKTVWRNKTGLQTFHNSVYLAAWVDAEFHYLFKLLQIRSKKLSLVGRATRTRTSTFTSDNDVNRLWSGSNSRSSQAVPSASPRDRPSGVFLQTPANRDPSPSASPPGETLIQHLKTKPQNLLVSLGALWSLSSLCHKTVHAAALLPRSRVRSKRPDSRCRLRNRRLWLTRESG